MTHPLVAPNRTAAVDRLHVAASLLAIGATITVSFCRASLAPNSED